MSKKHRRGRNEGSLYQRGDGRWTGSIVVGYHPETGNPRRKVVYGATKEEARQKLLDLQQKYQAGLLEAATMSLKVCLELWLDTGTYAQYKQRADDYIVPHLGHMALGKLTPFMISQWYLDLEKAGQSADTRNKVGQILRRCLKHAVGYGLLRDNVAMKVPLPRVDVEEMHPLDENQVKRFLAVARKNRRYPLYLLALDTGMRLGEIVALEWTDIDFTTGVVSITKSVRSGEKGGARLKDVKTKASRRRIRLSRRTLDALAEYRPTVSGKLIFPVRKKGPSRPGGGYLDKTNVRRAFHRLLSQAGLPQIRFHDLRHTHATLALLKTKNIKAVSARLGHADIRVTLDTYAHYLPAMEDELVAAMEDLLTPAAPPIGPETPESALQPSEMASATFLLHGPDGWEVC